MDEHLLRFDKEKELVFIDCETFNLCLHSCHNLPWQIAMIKVKGGRIIDSKDFYIKWDTHLKISKEAAIITKFSQSKLDKVGVPPEEIFPTVEDWLDNSDHILGHNLLGFDIYLIKSFYDYMGKDYSPLVNKVIDTLSLGRGLAHEVKYNPDDCFMEYQYRMIHKLKRGVRTTLKAMGESWQKQENVLAAGRIKSDFEDRFVISMDDETGNQKTILNFNPTYLIHSINKVEDMLFFTDNYNPPRFINVKRNYPIPIGSVDQITAESLLVIKKPPIISPPISMYNAAGENTFLENKILCFAYRYEYGDNDFSATSQWSKPAFIPKTFGLSSSDYTNEGMENSRNGVEITFNTGGPLVKGVEVLFKNSGDSVIKVIDNFNYRIS